MNKTCTRPCPVCGATTADVLCHQRFVVPDGYPLPSAYDIVFCSVCGMAYADTSATQRDYDRFYATCSIYQDPNVSSGGGEAEWDAERLDYLARTIAGTIPSGESRVLDVGCANGGLLSAIKKRGFTRLTGLDPSAVCVGNTQAKGIAAVCGDLLNLSQQAEDFDYVILSSVLEHLVDVGAAVGKVRALGSESLRVFIEVPDAARYVDFLQAPFQDFNTEHINHFSRVSLANLMRRFGFIPVLEDCRVIRWASWLAAALYGVYERVPSETKAGPLARDDELRVKLQAYVDASRDLMQKIDAHLRDLLPASQGVIVWGTGQLAMKLLCETVLGDMRIEACVDGNSVNHGKVFRGVRVVPPEEVQSSEIPIVVTTLLHEEDIWKRIRALRLKNPIVFLLPR